MSEYVKQLKLKHQEQERKRIGDVYDECIKRGCELNWLQCLDTRVWLYPDKQAKQLLSAQTNSVTNQTRLAEHINQYRILLEVLIEKRPNHEKVPEWKKALSILNNE